MIYPLLVDSADTLTQLYVSQRVILLAVDTAANASKNASKSNFGRIKVMLGLSEPYW